MKTHHLMRRRNGERPWGLKLENCGSWRLARNINRNVLFPVELTVERLTRLRGHSSRPAGSGIRTKEKQGIMQGRRRFYSNREGRQRT